MALSPCINLTFNGQCEEALAFYERTLGAKITFRMTWGESPMAKDAPPNWGGKMMHSSLTIGDTRFSGGDSLPSTYEAPRGFGVLLGLSDALEAERIFTALAEGGKVDVPLQEAFWAARFGSVTDRFGIPWQVNCEKPQ